MFIKNNISKIVMAGLLIAAMVFGFFTPFQLVFAEEQEATWSGFTITGSTVDELEVATEVVTVEDTESNPIDILTLSLEVSSSTTDSFSSTAINEGPISDTNTITIGSGSATTLFLIAIVGTTTEITVDIDVALTIYATTTPGATEMLEFYNMPLLNSININNATSVTVGTRPTLTVTSTPITATVSYIGPVSYIGSAENLEDQAPDAPEEVIIDEDEPDEVTPIPAIPAIFVPQGVIGSGGRANNATVPIPQNSANAFNQEDGTENEDTDENVEKVIDGGGGTAIIFTDTILPSKPTINTSRSTVSIPSTGEEIRESIFEIYTQILDLVQELTQIIQSQVTEKIEE